MAAAAGHANLASALGRAQQLAAAGTLEISVVLAVAGGKGTQRQGDIGHIPFVFGPPAGDVARKSAEIYVYEDYQCQSAENSAGYKKIGEDEHDGQQNKTLTEVVKAVATHHELRQSVSEISHLNSPLCTIKYCKLAGSESQWDFQ